MGYDLDQGVIKMQVKCPECGHYYYTSMAAKYDRLIECPHCGLKEMEQELRKHEVVYA